MPDVLFLPVKPVYAAELLESGNINGRHAMDKAAVSAEELCEYLTGQPLNKRRGSVAVGSVLEFSSVTPLAAPVPLEAIREAIPGFRVPQSYAWLRGDRAEAILRLCGVVAG